MRFCTGLSSRLAWRRARGGQKYTSPQGGGPGGGTEETSRRRGARRRCCARVYHNDLARYSPASLPLPGNRDAGRYTARPAREPGARVPRVLSATVALPLSREGVTRGRSPLPTLRGRRQYPAPDGHGLPQWSRTHTHLVLRRVCQHRPRTRGVVLPLVSARR